MSEWALLVEDDASWCEILTELLEDCGFKVQYAKELGQLEAHLRERSYQVAVVDLSLAGPDHRNQDGLRALEAIKKADPRCQTILLTGYATVELAVQVITEGLAMTCLRKENFSRAEFKNLLLKESQRAPEPHKEVSQERPPQNRGLALVVDDDAGWRSLLAELLEGEGLNCLFAASYAEARGHFQRENLTLAVIDFTLASSVETHNQDGLALLKVAREKRVPALVVSGTSDTNLIEQAFTEEDVSGFFEKQDFDRKAFCALIETMLTPSELAALTDREREVLELLAQGLTNPQIAENLIISTNTVKRHLKTVFEKLGVNNRAAAAAFLTRHS